MPTSEREMTAVVSLGTDDIETITESNDVVLAEFYAEWCGTCNRLEPVLDRIASDTEATVVTVDIETNLATAIEFGAQSTPSFVLFVDGRPVKQLRGGQDEATLRALIARYED